jgi:hypothetical protein
MLFYLGNFQSLHSKIKKKFMMRNIFILLLPLFCFISSSSSFTSDKYFNYLDPVLNAIYVNPSSNIIIRPNETINNHSLGENSIIISGSKSGKHKFQIITAESGKIIILDPVADFETGEVVTIEFTSKLKTLKGKNIEEFSYSFTTSHSLITNSPLEGLRNELPGHIFEKLLSGDPNNESGSNDDIENFPSITITHSDNPSPGYLFLSNIVFNVNIPNTPHLLILNNDGSPFFSRQMPAQIFNFDKQSSGNYTYFRRLTNKYYEMDTSFTVIDSFYTGNGYVTDLHELRVLPNRHALLMSYDKQIVDMSLIVPGGNPQALVTGLIIQEIDANKNVVFQWRSWDHFEITDATHESMIAPQIDYVHGNAIELDYDGNLMISSRHMDEITKIHRSTGKIIWRLGGKKNQFTFINDPDKFSYQHDIRRLSNGNITLFDNGNYHIPNYSRAIEYLLNEETKTATLVWQYRNTPVIYGYAMGSAQRLSNGNTLIGWGATNPTLTEVRPDGSKAIVLTFNTGVFSYRAFKYELGSGLVGIDPVSNQIPEKFELKQNYPNPFNPETNIEFNIHVPGHTRLIVFDVLGRVVNSLVNEHLSAGSYKVNFSGSTLSSGLYFYRLETGNFTETKKMLLVK